MKDRSRKTDVVIVGGGASGLAAAIQLRMSSDLDVLVIEKMDEPARKIRATGNGRCNITNTEIPDYFKLIGFFSRIGLVTRAYENGLVYPYSESAADVAEILTEKTCLLGASIVCGEEVESVRLLDDADAGAGSDNKNGTAAVDRSGNGARFEVVSKYKDGSGEHRVVTKAGYVILACGGKAGPMYGTTGDGYRIAKSLGHSVVTPVPVLTGIECKEWEKDHKPCAVMLAGTRARGVVRLFKKASGDEQAKELFTEEGEIQFTKYGLSGICVFNMTRHMRFDSSHGESLGDFYVTADLFPGRDTSKVLRAARERAFPDEPAGKVLRSVLKHNIADYVMQSASAPGNDLVNKKLKEISDEDIEAISSQVHAMTFHPASLRGWKDAQVTSGGVSLDEIEDKTSESKIVPGLYISGELADKDFRCGGFNLSNAWLSGIRAAEAISEEVKEK